MKNWPFAGGNKGLQLYQNDSVKTLRDAASALAGRNLRDAERAVWRADAAPLSRFHVLKVTLTLPHREWSTTL
jgi:hypothetical protein